MVKVTVAKEVVRLLGDLESAAAFDLVLEFSQRDLHRDVRIALLRALWDHLEDERVWPILEAAAVAPDTALARMAARTTSPRLSPVARRRLNALRVQLMGHAESRVRLEVLASLATNGSDPEKLLRDALFHALESKFPNEYTLAARAIWMTYTEDEDEIVAQAIKRLLPRRRALEKVLTEFGARTSFSRDQSLAMGRVLVSALQNDPILSGLRLKLASEVLPASEFAALLEAELIGPDWHMGVFVQVVALIQNCTIWSSLGKDMPVFQARWSASELPELRRLALAALLNRTRDAQGWTNERLLELRAFRKDSSALVASPAQFTFPLNVVDEEEDFASLLSL